MAEPQAAGAGADRLVVVVTRARDQAGEMKQSLERLGARVVLSPAIRIERPADWAPVDDAVRQLADYDRVIFTSTNAVSAFASRIEALGLRWDAISWPPVAAVGTRTARALEARGIEVGTVPEDFRAEGILEALSGQELRGSRILLPRAEKAREILPRTLARLGARVEVVTVYRTVPQEPAQEAVTLLSGRPGKNVVLTFTSGSTAENFISRLPGPARLGVSRTTVAAIGPVTRECLSGLGIHVDLLPAESTVPALVREIAAAFDLSHLIA